MRIAKANGRDLPSPFSFHKSIQATKYLGARQSYLTFGNNRFNQFDNNALIATSDASINLCPNGELSLLGNYRGPMGVSVWIHLTFATTSVMSSCCGESCCHSLTPAIILSVNSRAFKCSDSVIIDRSRSSPNSAPTGFHDSVTPSLYATRKSPLRNWIVSCSYRPSTKFPITGPPVVRSAIAASSFVTSIARAVSQVVTLSVERRVSRLVRDPLPS